MVAISEKCRKFKRVNVAVCLESVEFELLSSHAVSKESYHLLNNQADAKRTWRLFVYVLSASSILLASISQVALVAAQESVSPAAEVTNTAAEIFQSRIVPLLQSPEKSSCSECHLQGVELRDFLAHDQKQTFANLRARGWIDVEQPEKSKLLEFISRHTNVSTPMIQRIRATESEALKKWIVAAVREPELLKEPLPLENDLELPLEFIQHARTDQIVARFCEAIWSQLSRCASCHSPERNQQQVKKNGQQMSWIVPRDPAATLSLLVERKLIDWEDPEQSELRTKPLGLVKHGGGPKFVIGDQTDRKWLSFLEDYSKLKQGKLTKTDKLPTVPDRRSWLSEMQLKITDFPEAWKGRLLTLSLHPKNADGTWNDNPVATSDSPVNRKQLVWQHPLTVFQSVDPHKDETEWSKPLTAADAITPGRYQLRLHLGRLVVDEESRPINEIGPPSPLVLVATSELNAPWPPGYQPPKILSFIEMQQIQDTLGEPTK